MKANKRTDNKAADDAVNKTEGAEKKVLNLQPVDKVLLGVVLALIVAIIVLNVLNALGFALINGALMLYLPLMALLVLVGWGIYALIRRARRKVVRTVLTSVSIMLGLVALIIVFTYVQYLSYYTIPQKYATLASPTGARKVAVMRAFDATGDRSEARRAARFEAAPDSGEALIPEDVMVVYRAYPQVLGMFYRTKADVEGEVYLAYEQPVVNTEESAEPPKPVAGHGTLMVDWENDESAVRLYVDDPGVSEGGECVVTF